jgi:hypothetical protein
MVRTHTHRIATLTYLEYYASPVAFTFQTTDEIVHERLFRSTHQHTIADNKGARALRTALLLLQS